MANLAGALSTDGVRPSLPVRGKGDQRVYIRRCFCVGKNYAKHARELGCDPDKEPPVFFCKQAEDVFHARGARESVPFPLSTEVLHHEVELCAIIGREQPAGSGPIPRSEAMAYVGGWCTGLDMTRRDIQNEARRTGGPWDMSKSFPYAAPCSEVVPASEWPRDDWDIDPVAAMAGLRVTCDVNGEHRQEGVLGEMVWRVPDIIHYLSELTELRPGDLIMTGTPEGVGPVLPGDSVCGKIDGLPEVRIVYKSE
ncbi:unnamed protein product [Pedinophyceae sp. YPF-701]|nr:unnamed protein product [Pedinophyceae sp. YPF-701]